MHIGKGLNKGNIFPGILIGILALIAISLFMGPDMAEAAPNRIYDIEGFNATVVSGFDEGMIANGTFLKPDDVINVTAISAIDPSTLPGEDVLVLNLTVKEDGALVYSYSWNLTYNGSGKIFTGELTLTEDLGSDYVFDGVDLEIDVEDGYNVSLHNETMTYLHFMVDGDAPIITQDQTGTIVQYKGEWYSANWSSIDFTLNDTSTETSWFISNNKVSYRWDSGEWNTWSGASIPFNFSEGVHILSLKATDKLDHEGTWSRTYTVAGFMINETVITENVTLKDETVFVSDKTVPDGLHLTMENVTWVFLNAGDELKGEDGGKIDVNGSSISAVSDYYYTIIAEKGSTFLMNHTSVSAGVTGDPAGSTFMLYEGALKNCTVSNLWDRISILDNGVTLEEMKIETASTGSIHTNLSHRWSPEPVKIHDSFMNGTSGTPFVVEKASVWTPYDVDQVYYAEEGYYNLTFILSKSGLSSPYIKVPHFVHSLDHSAYLDVQYFQGGTWNSMSGFPKSKDENTDQWINGEGAKIDVSSVDDNSQVRIVWNSTDELMGCAYIGMPVVGGDGTEEKEITESPFNGVLRKWSSGLIGSYGLHVTNLTIENASKSFISVAISGNTYFEDIDLGGSDINFGASILLKSVNSSIDLRNSSLSGGTYTTSCVKSHFSRGDDWATSHLHNLSLGAFDSNKTDIAISTEGGWLQVHDLVIKKTGIGIKGEDTLLNGSDLKIEPSKRGISMELPHSYAMDDRIILMNVDILSGSLKETGICIKGDSLDYELNITLGDFDLSSDSSETYTRADSIGMITINVSSSKSPKLSLFGEISESPNHGMLLDWPSSGHVRINETNIARTELDGIFISDGLNVSGELITVANCDMLGINCGRNVILEIKDKGQSPSTVSNALQGGIKLGKGSVFYLKNVHIYECEGTGFSSGTISEGTLEGVKSFNNREGVLIDHGTTALIKGLNASGNVPGNGLHCVNSYTTIQKGVYYSEFRHNSGNGVFIDGGELSMKETNVLYNGDSGIKLWNVRLHHFSEISSGENGDNGLEAYIGNETQLSSSGLYCSFENSDITGNSGMGIYFSYSPAGVHRTIEVIFRSIDIYNNPEGELMAPSNVHVKWFVARDQLGREGTTGKARVNLDYKVLDGAFTHPEIINMNITLLGDGKKIVVGDSSRLSLINSNIKPSRSESRFSIKVNESASLYIYGGYLEQLYSLETAESSNLNVDGTLFRKGEGALDLYDTDFDIKNSQFTDIDGIGIMIDEGRGTIENSKFSENTIGIKVDGLAGELLIEGTEFVDNNWGIYVFNDSSDIRSNTYVNITECDFSGNSPTPLWVKMSSPTVLDSDIDPSKIQVTELNEHVSILYTLRVEVRDELNRNVEFDLTVNRGPGSDISNILDLSEPYSKEYETYRVNTDGILLQLETVEVSVRYLEYQKDDKEVFSTQMRTITLDEPIVVKFNGYKAPIIRTQNFKNDLNALEDIGLLNEVDLSLWFDDIGTDRGNLTFSAESGTTGLYPSVEGTYLRLLLEEDWNGDGTIYVIATDPHGISTRGEVIIRVSPVNDPPSASNPRITVVGGGTIPKTGDTIRAVWDWHDIDQGDREPTSKYIIYWHLNGTPVDQYNGMKEIRDVYSGQIWNFTVYPTDELGLNLREYGDPVHSQPVMVGNNPPTLTGVSIETRNPKTTTDIRAKPGSWFDDETNAVTFNYLWEKKVGNSFVSIGAPNSPLLDSRFTIKGDQIRVKAWVSDGMAISGIYMDEVVVQNSQPKIVSAKLLPERIDEDTNRIYVDDVEWSDPDVGDSVNVEYDWTVASIPLNLMPTSSEISKADGMWGYPTMRNITVEIKPLDNDGYGESITLTGYVVPTDTDGDGLFDDVNGNGRNDPGDDKDDDNDGYPDEWEIFLESDPKDPLSKPLDTDGDGAPDGDEFNTEIWMDLDDDNDRILDIHPTDPKYVDTYPKIASLPGDFDQDGIGDDLDPDIDDDGYLNENDDFPYNPKKHKEDKPEENYLFQYIIIFLIIMIVVAVAVIAYLAYKGVIPLPTQAPPTIGEEEGMEAIIDDESKTKKSKQLPPGDVEEMEELEDMRLCSICGEIISEEEDTCPNCGAIFGEDMDDDDEELDEERDEFEE